MVFQCQLASLHNFPLQFIDVYTEMIDCQSVKLALPIWNEPQFVVVYNSFHELPDLIIVC